MVYSDYDEKGMRKFKWNLNTGRSPWGMSTNAEVWNGRVAMLGFVLCIVLEGITGTGVIPFVTCKGVFQNVLLLVAYAGGIAGIGWLMVQINKNKDVDESLNVQYVYDMIQKENADIRQKTGTAAAWAAKKGGPQPPSS